MIYDMTATSSCPHRCKGFSHCDHFVPLKDSFCSIECQHTTEALESTNISPPVGITFSWLHPRAGGMNVKAL